MNDKYLHYNLEDFISDEDFIRSITDPSQSNAWDSWVSANPELAPRIAEAKEMIAALRFKEEPFDNKDRLWARIDRSTQAKEIELPRKDSSIRWLWLSVAASAACIALFIALNGTQPGPVITENMGLTAMHITLPSGSMVDLQPGAQIDYDESLWDTERKIQLTGAATFDVTKGRSFTVITDNGAVRVLGTQFTVDSHDDSFLVDVTEGRVEVTAGTQKEILTAGMRFNKNPSYQDIQSAKSNDSQSKVNIYQFDKTKLDDVLMTIESEYGVKLIADATIKEMIYTGFFKSNDLDAALYNVFWPLEIKYTVEDKTITLSQD